MRFDSFCTPCSKSRRYSDKSCRLRIPILLHLPLHHVPQLSVGPVQAGMPPTRNGIGESAGVTESEGVGVGCVGGALDAHERDDAEVGAAWE